MEQSQEFQPNSDYLESQQRFLTPKKQQKYVSGSKNGKWSQEQNAKYIVYIEFHKDKMRSKQKRRFNKLYKQMSKFIGTRNALQCRSHHQKLEDRYLYPNKIIINYKLHNNSSLYDKIKQELELYEQNNAISATSLLKLQKIKNDNVAETNQNTPELNLINTTSQNNISEVITPMVNLSWNMNPYNYIPSFQMPTIDIFGNILYYQLPQII